MAQTNGLHFELVTSKADRDAMRGLGLAHGEMVRHIANRVLDVLCPWEEDGAP